MAPAAVTEYTGLALIGTPLTVNLVGRISGVAECMDPTLQITGTVRAAMADWLYLPDQSLLGSVLCLGQV